MEDYFELLEHKKNIDICRFRTSNHMLPIEQGRWDNRCFFCVPGVQNSLPFGRML
jgi:hypothetical protein